MEVKVYGGPEDGGVVVVTQAGMVAELIIEGRPFTYPPESNPEFTMGQKFYRYRLHRTTRGCHYDYEGEFVRAYDKDSTEGGDHDAVAEARGGGDHPGPEHDPEQGGLV